MDTFVYVARAVRSKLVKIGYTTNPAQRLKNLSGIVGEHVELVALMRGDENDECALLRRVREHEVTVKGHGEWHAPHPDVDALIASLPKPTGPRLVVGPSVADELAAVALRQAMRAEALDAEAQRFAASARDTTGVVSDAWTVLANRARHLAASERAFAAEAEQLATTCARAGRR